MLFVAWPKHPPLEQSVPFGCSMRMTAASSAVPAAVLAALLELTAHMGASKNCHKATLFT